VLRAWIEEGQLIAGQVKVKESLGMRSLDQINFNVYLRAA
jgi:hypothetical protein